MEKHSKRAGKMNARTRRHKGGFVAFCLITALVLVVGTGLMSQRVDTARPLSENNQVTSSSQVLPETNSHMQKASETFEIATDPEYGEFEKGKVLVAVDEATDRARLNALLETIEFVYTKDISDQDISAGFVQVEVSDSVSMEQVLTALSDAGLKAQPNYVYHTVADEAEIDNSASVDDTRADIVNEEAQMIPEGDTASETQSQGVSQPANDLDTLTAFVDRVVNAVDEPEALSIAAAQISDPGASQQWALESLDLYRAWAIAKCKEDNATSPKVSVAVIDTGCAVTHEDLINNIRATYNSSTLQPGVDQVADLNGHGTHVAGIVAADANNGIGVAGTSYDAGLVIIKATTDDAGRNFTTATLAQAYTWLLTSSGAKTNAQAYNVRVVNMSVGGEGSIVRDDVLYKRITDAKNAGILTVCAAGNAQGTSVPPYNCIPGDYEDCFTVINLQGDTSADPNDSSGYLFVSRSSGSNYNVASGELSQAKNISAPGTSVYSTVMSGAYGYMSGTSMASPAVAGVAALLFAYDASLSADDARALLEQTATDIGDKGWDAETGYGEVDAYCALQMLSAQISNGSMESAQTASLEISCGDGSTLPTSDWSWTSSNPEVLEVDEEGGTVTAKGNGTATLTGTHKTVSSRTVTKEVRVGGPIDFNNVQVEIPSSQTYTGDPIEPKVTVKLDGVTLTEGSDYTLEYSNNINVSAEGARITIKPGSSGGTNSKTVLFQIEPADISKATIGTIPNQTYTGQEVKPTPVVTYNSRSVSSDNYEVTYRNNTNPCVDYAEVIITGKGNFTGTKSQTFSILANFNDVTIEPIADKEYTGSAITLTDNELKVSYKGMNLASGPAGDYTLTYSNNTAVGTATVKLTVNSGGMFASGSKTVTFKIVARNLANGVDVAAIPNQTYSGSAIKPAVNVTYQGKKLALGTDYNVTYSNNTDVGTAKVTITGVGPNYTGSISKTFEIKGILITPATVSGVEDKTYNGSVQTQENLRVVLNGKVLVRDTDYRVSYRDFKTQESVAPREAGEYEVVITGIGKYSGTISRVFPIYATSSGGTNSGSSSNNSGNSGSSGNNSGTNDGASSAGLNASASKPAPSAATVTGSWKKSSGKWWFAYDSTTKKAQSNKAYPTSQWVKIKGKLYHFDSKGWMSSGWYKENGYWYYFGSDGAMKTGWQKVKGKWYYLAANGIMQTGKVTISGQTYYLDTSSGAMKTGWNKESNGWYYYKSSGALAKGWQKVKNKWYYLNPTHGLMATNWQTIGGVRYFLNPSSGAMLTGWARLNDVWYYFKSSGALATGWQKVSGKWYYLDPSSGAMKTGFYDVQGSRYYSNSSGAMLTGWQKINNKWYYFNKSGAMQKNTWIGSYHLNADGVWDTSR